jgi:hypothetical protein
MKGIHLTSLVEFAESRFSIQVSDAMLAPQGLPSSGIYTQVGTYDHRELLELVRRLSRLTHVPAPQLFREFGEYLYTQFVKHYSRLCVPYGDCLELLAQVHTHIHHEASKLYPDAELPLLKAERIDADHLVLNYESPRGLADLAEGLIRGCVQQFGANVDIQREDDPHSPGTRACFRLTRHPNP